MTPTDTTPAPDFDASKGMCYPNGIRHLMPTIRVACLTLDGSTMTVPAKNWADVVREIVDEGGDDAGPEGCETVYTLTFKTMLVRDYEALGEFDGF